MLRALTLAAAASTLFAPFGFAQDDRLAADVSVGTTGVSGELKFALSEHVVLRGGYNWLDFEMDGEEYDGVVYDATLDFSTASAFLDIHPFANGFLVSGGAYAGAKEVNAVATPSEPVEIGGMTFTPDQVGRLDIAADMEDLAPFAGIGWDNTFSRDSRLGVKLLAGVMFSGSPQVDLTSSGGALSDDPNFQAEIQEEEAAIQSDLDDYEYYPIVSLGLTWRF